MVIGKKVRKATEESAMDSVFGYAVVNDVTARELQKKHMQWYLGKSLEGFFPMGQFVVTKDEVNVFSGLNIKSFVNGELRQNSNTSLMIHSIREVVASMTTIEKTISLPLSRRCR